MTTAREPMRFHHSHPVSGYPVDGLRLDQQLALQSEAERLATEVAGIYGSETIQRFLLSSYDEFAERATVPSYLPLLAEQFARQRLHALARVEGHHSDGFDVAAVRPIRDELERRVLDLLGSLDLTAQFAKS